MSKDKHPHDEVIRAWLDGKEIEMLIGNKWIKLTNLKRFTNTLPVFNVNNRYRIAKQPEYRPVKTFEESLPFVGKVLISKTTKRSIVITGSSLNTVSNRIMFCIRNTNVYASVIFQNYTLLDGSPVGILEE